MWIKEADKAGVEVESLRFYFSNLPNEQNYPNGREVVHPRQNGIFILPTVHNEERNEEYGFYIGKDGEAKLIRDWSASQKGQSSLGAPVESSKSAEASLNPFSWRTFGYASRQWKPYPELWTGSSPASIRFLSHVGNYRRHSRKVSCFTPIRPHLGYRGIVF